MLLIIFGTFHNYFLASALASTFRNWPQPRPRPSSSGLGLEVLVSFNITDKYTVLNRRILSKENDAYTA